MKNNFKKILLINFGGLGDEILFLPVVSSLKKTFPDSKITLALESRSKAVKNLTNGIDEIFVCDIKNKNKYTELLKLIFFARKQKFNIVVSSGANCFVSIILFLTGIKKRFGYDCGFLSRLFLTNVVPLNKNQYAAKMYHDLICNISDEEFKNPSICFDSSKIEKVENSVLVHPGVSKMSVQKNIFKSLSEKNWAKIINGLLERGKTVFLAGGPDDDEIVAKILPLINIDSPNFVNMYQKTKNIEELVELLMKVDTVVCSDSAPMHISVALNLKTIAFFAATDEKKLLPLNSNKFIPVFNKNLSCRPCLWDKRVENCEDSKCLDIDVEEILKHID